MLPNRNLEDDSLAINLCICMKTGSQVLLLDKTHISTDKRLVR